MTTKIVFAAAALMMVLPAVASAQGLVRGAEEGADRGAAAAGPVGGVVGGAVGAAAGTVGGALGVPDRRPCSSSTVTRENSAGDSSTVHRTDCP